MLKEIDNMIDINDQINKKSPSSSIQFSCAYGIVQYVIKINDITKIEVLMLYNERKMVILLISIMKLIKYQVLLNSHVHMGLYSTILK